MIKSLKNRLFLILLIYLSAFMLISPRESMAAVSSSIELCGQVIIPTLFPFIFCSNLFISLGAARIIRRYLSGFTHKIFGISGSGTLAIILGVLCGYPIGAITSSTLYKSGECSKDEAERLLSFCNNASPVFVISVVGVGLLSSYKTGVILYLIHILTAFIYGFLLKFFTKENSSRYLYPVRDENGIDDCILDIGDVITQSIETILKICGFIIIFSVITSAIPDFVYKPYLTAFLEISAGIKSLCSMKYTTFTLPLISAFLSFSGISVLSQVSAVTKPVGLSLRHYLVGKSVQSVISFILTLVVIRIFPDTIPVFSPYNVAVYHIPTERELIYLSLLTLITAVIVIVIMLLIAKISEKFDL